MGRLERRLALLGLLLLCACSAAGSMNPAPLQRDVVVLVHGMGRTSLSMRPLARKLEQAGFATSSFDYSSTRYGVDELCAQLAAHVAKLERDEDACVHFVGHSLGNLLIRGALGAAPPAHVGRIVMLAPPNRGAAAADALAPWFGWLLEPLDELGPAGVAARLPVPPLRVGVIAGTLDGKVSVEETHLSGEKDHVSVPALHSFLMNRADVQELTLRFLRSGSFAPES
jgi:Serine aminopeptidase, S33